MVPYSQGPRVMVLRISYRDFSGSLLFWCSDSSVRFFGKYPAMDICPWYVIWREIGSLRLEALGLYSLQRRRLRGDLIETYKILTGEERINSEQLFQKATTIDLRGHSFKLYKKRSRPTTGHKKILFQPKNCRLLEQVIRRRSRPIRSYHF